MSKNVSVPVDEDLNSEMRKAIRNLNAAAEEVRRTAAEMRGTSTYEVRMKGQLLTVLAIQQMQGKVVLQVAQDLEGVVPPRKALTDMIDEEMRKLGYEAME